MATQTQTKAQKRYDEHQAQIKIKFDLRKKDDVLIYQALQKKKDARKLKEYIMQLVHDDLEGNNRK